MKQTFFAWYTSKLMRTVFAGLLAIVAIGFGIATIYNAFFYEYTIADGGFGSTDEKVLWFAGFSTAAAIGLFLMLRFYKKEYNNEVKQEQLKNSAENINRNMRGDLA